MYILISLDSRASLHLILVRKCPYSDSVENIQIIALIADFLPKIQTIEIMTSSHLVILSSFQLWLAHLGVCKVFMIIVAFGGLPSSLVAPALDATEDPLSPSIKTADMVPAPHPTIIALNYFMLTWKSLRVADAARPLTTRLAAASIKITHPGACRGFHAWRNQLYTLLTFVRGELSQIDNVEFPPVFEIGFSHVIKTLQEGRSTSCLP